MAENYNALHADPSIILRPLMQDDSPTVVVEDSTGNDSDGTLANAGNTEDISVSGTGFFAKALHLDGVNDYLNFGAVGNFSLNQAFSGAVWIRPDAVLSTFQVFLARQQPPPGLTGWVLRNGGGGYRQKLAFAINNNAGNQIFIESNAAIFTSSRWYHVGFSYNGNGSSSGIQLYVDGSAIAFSGSSSISGTITNSESLGVGARVGDTGGAFDGILGPAFLRSAVTTATEMAEDFAGPEPRNTVAPVLHPDGTVTSGSWDSQNNGPITITATLYDASDDSVVTSSTSSNPDFSASVSAGQSYYVIERASNLGGFASQEDTLSNVQTVGGGPTYSPIHHLYESILGAAA